MKTIVNGAPLVIALGAKDDSTVAVARKSTPIPQHLPIFPIFAEAGGEGRFLADSADRVAIFGEKTFDPASDYFKHSTAGANIAAANGNLVAYYRVVPSNAGPKANMVVWLDVLPTTVDRYERLSDGSIKTDSLSRPIVIGSTAGFKVKWVVTHYTSQTDFDNLFGKETQVAGDQTDGSVTSVRYPIFAMAAYSKGKRGNNRGLRFYGLTQTLGNLPTAMMQKYHSFPFVFEFIERTSELEAATRTTTIFGEPSVMVTFDELLDPATDKDLFIGTRLKNDYTNTTDTKYELRYGDWGDMVLFKSNIRALQRQFQIKEAAFTTAAAADFNGSEDQAGMFNLVTGVNTLGVPYETFVFVDDTNSTKFSENTNVWAKGGSDGTMSLDALDAAMDALSLRYLDTSDRVQDGLLHPENVVYDTGYGVATKKNMGRFISRHKGMAVFVGTHVYGGKTLTASEEYSLCQSIVAAHRLYPDSDYFGTAAFRSCVFAGSWDHLTSGLKGRVPSTFELLEKLSRFAGASDGIWKTAQSPEGYPGHLVKYMVNPNIVTVPNTNRNRYWDAGAMFALPFDHEQYMIPAYRTIYSDDTSIYASVLPMLGEIVLQRVCLETWARCVGRTDLDDASFLELVENTAMSLSQQLFAGYFIVEINATMTADDTARGYSYTLEIVQKAAVGKTVQTSYVRGLRRNS